MMGRGHNICCISFILFSLHYHISESQNPSSSEALLSFKNSLSNSDSLTNWKSDEEESSPCDSNNIWLGIVCDEDKKVTSINLASMGLQGTPDVSAFAPSLQNLESISLQNNSLVGPIPAFNLVPGLKAIYASNNQFVGVIPPNYFQPLTDSLKRIWLSDNKFSGPIPNSIGDLTSLKELYLQNNQFSGPIPEFSEPDVLTALDLSNNKLQGPIPMPLNRFDKEAFENNPHLCGPKASKDCPPNTHSFLAKKLLIAAIVMVLLLLIMSLKDKRKQENMRILRKENYNQQEAVVTIIPSFNSRKSSSSSRKKSRINKESRSSPKPGSSGPQPVGELVMVNEEKVVFTSQDLMKASAEVLGNGSLGSAYKATLENGVCVVLKKMKEMNNRMGKDEFDEEMRKLGRLKHDNVLTPLAYHFRKEDKFLVYEYVPKGSLHNVLHGDKKIKQSELSWGNRLKMIKGVARGMSYLHSELNSYDLPHGNLKSCNVLIGQNYEPLVSDYALHPFINNTQSMFAYRSPDQQICHKSDVYCFGIVILEMVTGKYPSQYVMNQKGESGTDVVQWVRSALDENRQGELIDPDLLADDAGGQIEKLLHIGAACTESEVHTRIDMKEALTRIEDV